jgi:hypothetical protein
MNKKWYESKTIWVNGVATAAIIIQVITNKDVIPAEQQAIILSLINLALRAITKDKIEW